MSEKLDRIPLDYRSVASTELLENLSGIAVNDDTMWTVSDEGRTIECLKAEGDGFVLRQQYRIDQLVEGLPGAADGDDLKGDELDLESIDFHDGMLWICGSHCNVRKKPKRKSELRPEIRSRPSRHFLARIKVKTDGFSLGKVSVAPRTGAGSIRGMLAKDPFVGPFIELPSKENGVDIEGIAVSANETLLGLRGPVLDGFAVVVHLTLSERLSIKEYTLSFLDLAGLAIRDITLSGGRVLIIAGPVSDADGPFALYEWTGKRSAEIQHPRQVYQWQRDPGEAGSAEKPEGICRFDRSGKPGHAVVYDRPRADRVSGSMYLADWFPYEAKEKGN